MAVDADLAEQAIAALDEALAAQDLLDRMRLMDRALQLHRLALAPVAIAPSEPRDAETPDLANQPPACC